jgi:hypothetical protein
MEIIKPFKIIKQIKPVFLLFIIMSIIIGQIGIIGSITLGATETILSMRELLIINLDAGNLYTFSIALIATSFNQYFIDFLIEEEVLFKKYKIILAVISIALIIFMTLFYSVHQLHSLENSLNKTDTAFQKSLSLDWPQIVFYIICIILSTYMFCVNFLKLDPESYIEIDDQNLLKLKKSTKKVGTDSQGTRV